MENTIGRWNINIIVSSMYMTGLWIKKYFIIIFSFFNSTRGDVNNNNNLVRIADRNFLKNVAIILVVRLPYFSNYSMTENDTSSHRCYNHVCGYPFRVFALYRAVTRYNNNANIMDETTLFYPWDTMIASRH